MIAFALERLYAISFPLKAVTVITSTKRTSILACIHIVCLLICIPVLFVYEVFKRGNRKYADCLDSNAAYLRYAYVREAFMFVDVVFRGIPCFLLLPINIALVIQMRLSAFKERKAGGGNKESSNMSSVLVALSFLYLVTNVPYLIVSSMVMADIGADDVLFRRRLSALNYITSTLKFVNFAINGFVYAAKFEYFIPTLKAFFKVNK